MTVEESSDASGGKYVKLNGDVYTYDTLVVDGTLVPEASGEVGFELSFDRTGRYSIWVRYIATSGGMG